MASTRKPATPQKDLPPKRSSKGAGKVTSGRKASSTKNPRRAGTVAPGAQERAVLDGAGEAGVLLDNLKKVRELLSQPAPGDEDLQSIARAILARLRLLHSVPSPESCRNVGRFFAGLSLADAKGDDLALGDMVPAKSEVDASGAITKKITRNDAEFANLVSNSNADIVFKDEEGTGADRMMSTRLKEKMDKLATAVAAEWAGTKLRVTEAWDEDNEHAGNSLHYEGRAADLTTSPVDSSKLGRLGRLAVDAGFDWVWYENSAHVHVSVTK